MRSFIFAATASVVMLSQSLPVAASVKPTAKTTNLEGMDYVSARKVILGYGWQPLPGNCGGGGASNLTCSTYPEIGNCSGSGVGFCDMTFVRPNRCLVVVTVGGAPDAKKHGESVVRDVQFRRGTCSKD
jgi:hypothetical protein